MKTKELIKRLQELDPTGEVECCVGNEDIYFLMKVEAYYDGTLQVLLRDPTLEGKCYSIIGGKYQRRGQKIKIVPMGIDDVVYEMPDIPIDYSELSPSDRVSREAAHNELREQAKKDAVRRR